MCDYDIQKDYHYNTIRFGFIIYSTTSFEFKYANSAQAKYFDIKASMFAIFAFVSVRR